jgi:hypothetical protein
MERLLSISYRQHNAKKTVSESCLHQFRDKIFLNIKDVLISEIIGKLLSENDEEKEGDMEQINIILD